MNFNTLILFIAAFLLLFSTARCTISESTVSSGSDPSQNQGADYYPEWSFSDQTYVNNIKSILLHPKGAPLGPSFVDLSAPNPLVLRFDDLNGGYENYYMQLVHCTYDWTPSDLSSSDYIQGFNELLISEIEQSFNSQINYTHYYAEWPNDMSTPLLSGNFLLKVYSDGNEDAPIFTRRIVVTEQLVRFRPNVKAATVVSERRYRQEVDFDIVQVNYQLFDPYKDLDVAILQNFRWDNVITDLKPVFMKGTELAYDFDEENNFDGLNEFRWFDTKSLRYAALGTDSVRLEGSEWHTYLTPDLRRTYDVYRTDPDVNGAYLIRNDDFDDHLEAQYVYVHFSLPFDAPILQSEIYIVGKFNGFEHSENNRMKWNAATKRYEATLLLKQGYYNYMYSLVSAQHPDGDQAFLEGTHQQTENVYTILAYYYDLRGYDRLVGILNTNTFED